MARIFRLNHMFRELPVTGEEADELVLGTFGVEVEDYELNELGHVYTLYNGGYLVIRLNGKRGILARA